jgi:hypothetical protein
LIPWKRASSPRKSSAEYSELSCSSYAEGYELAKEKEEEEEEEESEETNFPRGKNPNYSSTIPEFDHSRDIFGFPEEAPPIFSRAGSYNPRDKPDGHPENTVIFPRPAPPLQPLSPLPCPPPDSPATSRAYICIC